MNCNLRTYANLRCPKKLLIGPWLHRRPDQGVPGPAINHWRERGRFFSHRLGGLDTGMMDEPPIAVYIQTYDPPLPNRVHTSGYWRQETEWPLARGRDQTLHLGPGILGEGPTPALPRPGGPGASADELVYDPTVGATLGSSRAGEITRPRSDSLMSTRRWPNR